MSILTRAACVRLTRSFKKFTFTSEYDRVLPYSDCSNLGLYVHIPFCTSLCNFCPYCKQIYEEQLCKRYIDSLIAEIHLVGNGGNGGEDDGRCGKKRVTSLYFGGGTPALVADRLGEIIQALRAHFEITDTIGVELHPDNVTPQLLATLKAAGVNAISIGIQSFSAKYSQLLGRTRADAAAIGRALAAVPFQTVSMDFIFALPGQTFDDIKNDVNAAFANGANHIAVYPFIDFTFTDSRVRAMRGRQKRELLDRITLYLQSTGCKRNSVWTFSRGENVAYSSMTRDNFLGFGCSATTLLNDQFKINTFSVEEYCRRVEGGCLPTSLTLRFRRRQWMVYYLFWKAYSTQVDEGEFYEFFGVPLKKMYGAELRLAQRLGFITREGGKYTMTLKGAYYFHYFENFYTLAYIDKMWGIMRRQAFPKKIKL